MSLLGRLLRGGRHSAAPFVRTVPVIINCRDRVTCLRALVEWLERAGHENIVLLDNASTYPPLLDYLQNSPHRVEHLAGNLGHTAAWQVEPLAEMLRAQWFVYTDPDVVPDEACPAGVVERLRDLLEEHPAYVKAGPALRTDDLPAHYRRAAEVIEHERQFYARPLGPELYDSFIDTTFALYRPGTPYSHGPALRSTRYRARHLAWYVDSAHPGEEEAYYSRHADRAVTNWNAGNGETPP
jgi:hypothetical protein